MCKKSSLISDPGNERNADLRPSWRAHHRQSFPVHPSQLNRHGRGRIRPPLAAQGHAVVRPASVPSADTRSTIATASSVNAANSGVPGRISVRRCRTERGPCSCAYCSAGSTAGADCTFGASGTASGRPVAHSYRNHARRARHPVGARRTIASFSASGMASRIAAITARSTPSYSSAKVRWPARLSSGACRGDTSRPVAHRDCREIHALVLERKGQVACKALVRRLSR